MQRRDLLKLSPAALAASAGYVSMANAQTEVHATETVYNVRSFGATGDGKTVDTPAINKAIDAVAAVGGGTLVFPAGTYISFTIHLKSNVELNLSQGSTIQAADSPKRGETPATTAAPTMRPNPTIPGPLTRTMATTTGATHSSTPRTSTTSPSAAPASSSAKAFLTDPTAPVAPTTTSSLPSPASAIRPSPSRTAATSCCATSASSREATSPSLPPASTT